MIPNFVLMAPPLIWKIAAAVLILAILSKPLGRKAIWFGLSGFVRFMAMPFRGSASKKFKRVQRERGLVVSTVDDETGVIPPHRYITKRRNFWPMGPSGTWDIWLNDSLPPSALTSHLTALSWGLKNDETFFQDFAHVRHTKVRLFSKEFYPKLQNFLVAEKTVRKAIKKVPLGVYLGTAAGFPDLVISLHDIVLTLVVGRPGSGKSVVGGWVINSLLYKKKEIPIDIAVFDFTKVDHQHYGDGVKTLNSLEELDAHVSYLEKEATARLSKMNAAIHRYGKKISDVNRYSEIAGESFQPLCLVVDEMQELFGKKLSGPKELVDLKKSIAARIDAICGTYRKVGLHIILLGTASTHEALPALSFGNAGVRISGCLGHPATAQSFFSGAENYAIAANDSLRDGRMCILAAFNNGLPPRVLVMQLALGTT